jgi:hypothetical protein
MYVRGLTPEQAADEIGRNAYTAIRPTERRRK